MIENFFVVPFLARSSVLTPRPPTIFLGLLESLEIPLRSIL